MQWSAFGHDNRGSQVRSPDIRWPLFYLVLPSSGQRLPKLLPYCPQMGLAMVICICGSIEQLASCTHHQRKREKLDHYKKSKPELLMGGSRLSISLHQCLLATKGTRCYKKKKEANSSLNNYHTHLYYLYLYASAR